MSNYIKVDKVGNSYTVDPNATPSGGSATAYAWTFNGSDMYLNIDVAPETAAIDDIKILKGSADNADLRIENFMQEGDTYTYVSNTEFTISWEGGSYTGTRNVSNDVSIWE